MARASSSLLAAVTFLVALVGGVPRAGAAPLAGSDPVVEVSRRADVAVVTYREILGEIGDADRGPVLQIFGDGRVLTRYPAYMKRAGEYEQRLAPAELDALVRSLARKGVLEFDPVATRAAARASVTAARQRAQAAGGPVTVFEAADAATTVIEVAVERYQPARPGARGLQHETRRAVWTGLRSDAQHHADVPTLRDLAAAEQELRTLRERPGATRVR
jgi:hypothetical protein